MTLKETSKWLNACPQTMRVLRTRLAEKRAVKPQTIIGETTVRFGTVSLFWQAPPMTNTSNRNSLSLTAKTPENRPKGRFSGPKPTGTHRFPNSGLIRNPFSQKPGSKTGARARKRRKKTQIYGCSGLRLRECLGGL